MTNVMIAEDDTMIADLLEEALIGEGYDVCGIAQTVAEGVALARLHKPDLAIIDMRLADGGFGTEIVSGLDQDVTPGILYATANPLRVMAGADGDGCISKPYHIKDLIRSLEIISGLMATGIATPPFPAGFQLLTRADRSHREIAHAP